MPQDDSFLEGHRKAAYAVDGHGKYVVVPSRGYEAEKAATSVALLAQDRAVLQAWEAVRRGEKSPLAYHLAVRQWTTGLAAAHVGVARWRIWWHQKPRVFRALPDSLFLRYCQALAVTPEELATVPDAPEQLLDAGEGEGELL